MAPYTAKTSLLRCSWLAGTGIIGRSSHLMTSVIWFYIDDDAAPGCELDGIPYQIVQDLGKSPRVCRDGRRARIEVLFNDHAGLHQLGRSVEHLTHKLVKICLHHRKSKADALSALGIPAK